MLLLHQVCILDCGKLCKHNRMHKQMSSYTHMTCVRTNIGTWNIIPNKTYQRNVSQSKQSFASDLQRFYAQKGPQFFAACIEMKEAKLHVLYL